jgi:hypothetical protein
MRSAFVIAVLVHLPVACDAAEPFGIDSDGPGAARQCAAPFLPFLDRDLRTLDPIQHARLVETLSGCLPRRYGPGQNRFGPWYGWWNRFVPWYGWRSPPSQSGGGFLLFQVDRANTIPGECRAAVHFLDRSGELLYTAEFGTGNRIDIRSATLRREPLAGGWVLDVCSCGVIGPDVARQVYGLPGGRVVLLRLENSAGRAVPDLRNAIGPVTPARTPAEWEKLVCSGKTMATLEALAWLGGGPRWNGPEWARDPTGQIETVLKRPGVQKALAELARSKNHWLAEAAALASRPVGQPQ